ncbi:glycosyltransferase family 87 protein [Microvirga pakistanensis]|uniref:glycosyltransferase family 87 protein n=1 Tax=Microvirga pakistanensis TaxID=1682650 RepID=UPI0010698816|nr:glycosyltransferase family 87 protein [Microvirga pakistanensis]
MAASTRWLINLIVLVLSFLAISAEFPRIAHDDGLWDFGSFVASGRAAAEGLNPYGIYPLTLHVELPGFESWNPNLNPPISALLFQLFDGPEPRAAFETWRWISIAFYSAAVLLLVWRFWSPQAPIMALWTFALAGFWDTLFLGQIYLPLAFVAIAGWLLLERGQVWAAGIMIGLLVSMKPNFLVWPVLLLLAGSWRPALAALATAALVSAIPLLVYGFEVYRQWFELIASDKERAFFLTNTSLAGFAARAGMPLIGVIASLALLGGLAAWAFWRRPNAMAVSALGLVASLLASPLGWVHYTLFLLPVFLSHWHKPAMRIVTLLLIVPVPMIIDQFTKPAWNQLTFGSVYGWAMVLCLALLAAMEIRRRNETSSVSVALSGLGDVRGAS